MIKQILIQGFWERVEEACGKSGLSKSEIARRMNTDRVNLYPKNNKMMSAGNIARFCVVTKVSSDWLLGIKAGD